MPRPYDEELVIAESEDGILMQGAVIRPTQAVDSTTAVVWVHGLTSTFYSVAALGVGRALAEAGITLISGNNRGHDFGAGLRTRAGDLTLGGGGWERFEESPRDVAGWMSFAERLGYARIVLLGHSLGALKVIHYQATRQDPRVAGLIAASPPIRTWLNDPDRVALARQMVDTGRGRELLPWADGGPGFGIISAQTYLERVELKLGSSLVEGDKAPLAEIHCPLLAIFGTDEPEVGGPDQLATIQQAATGSDQVSTLLIEGADHVYTGREREVARVIASWLGEVSW